jgi:DNA-binding response OmpR family regulator
VGLAIADPARLSRWQATLACQGWPVQAFPSLPGLLEAAADCRVGLGLVDLGLIGERGMPALKERAAHFLWIVVGNGKQSQDLELALSLENGADDCISEKIDPRVLTAKLRAYLRRLLPTYATFLETVTDPGGRVRVERTTQRVTIKEAAGWKPAARMTPTEIKILCFFLERTNVALDRQAILEGVWLDRAGEVNAETVDRHVESLRAKLGRTGQRLETLYGVGYVFRGEA